MSVITYETNASRAGHFLGLVLAKLAGDKSPDNGIAILAGSGAPSGATYGGQTLAPGQNAIAIDAASADVDALVYGTINGGTNWYPLDFTPGAVASLALARGFVIRGSAAGVGEALDGGAAQGIIYSDGTDMQRGTIQAHAQITTSSVSTGLTAAGANTAAGGTGATGAPSADDTASANVRQEEYFGALAAAGANYIAAYNGGAGAIDDAVGPFVNFLPTRTVQILGNAALLATTWTIDGTDMNGTAVQDTINHPGGAVIAEGDVAMRITRVRSNIDPGAGATATVEAGAGFGTGSLFSAALVSVDGVVEAPVLADAATGTIIPTSAPNGARVYVVRYNMGHVHGPGTHTHTGPSHDHAAGAITVTEAAHAHTGTPDAHSIA